MLLDNAMRRVRWPKANAGSGEDPESVWTEVKGRGNPPWQQ
jgi:hypothetical protein